MLNENNTEDENENNKNIINSIITDIKSIIFYRTYKNEANNQKFFDLSDITQMSWSSFSASKIGTKLGMINYFIYNHHFLKRR